MINDSLAQISIYDEHLASRQKWHSLWITNLIPFFGFIVGIVLIFYWGIGWLEISMLASMYFITVIGLEVGFHRFFAHKSFETSNALMILLAISGSMCAQGPIVYWVANHRRHHKHSDQMGDPHSPYIDRDGAGFKTKLLGLWHAHIGWQVRHNSPSTSHFTKDLLKNKIIFRMNQLYFVWLTLGIVLPAIVGGLLLLNLKGVVIGLIWGGLARIFILNNFTFSINSICHMFGRRPFDTKENSRNNIWLALPSFGQSWHNNHHAFPYSAVLNFQWWQVDLAGNFILFLKRIGLATNVKKPNTDQIRLKKMAI